VKKVNELLACAIMLDSLILMYVVCDEAKVFVQQDYHSPIEMNRTKNYRC